MTTKEVLIRIKGMQFMASDEESDAVETLTYGSYSKEGEMHCIVYDEVEEGMEESTKVLLKFRDEYMELHKTGLVNLYMIFEKEQMNQTSYQTPYGDILFGIHGKNVAVKENLQGIKVNATYSLDMNYEFLCDCDLNIEAVFK